MLFLLSLDFCLTGAEGGPPKADEQTPPHVQPCLTLPQTTSSLPSVELFSAQSVPTEKNTPLAPTHKVVTKQEWDYVKIPTFLLVHSPFYG